MKIYEAPSYQAKAKAMLTSAQQDVLSDMLADDPFCGIESAANPGVYKLGFEKHEVTYAVESNNIIFMLDVDPAKNTAPVPQKPSFIKDILKEAAKQGVGELVKDLIKKAIEYLFS